MEWLRAIIRGIGSILCMFPNLQDSVDIIERSDEDALRSDCDALRSDWVAVGNDIKKSIEQVDKNGL